MCQKCNGLGTEVTFDRDLVIPDENLTLREGALKPVGRIDTDRKSMRAIFYFQVFDELGVPLDKKWKDFSKKEKELILNGSGDQRYKINWGRHGSSLSRFEGIPRFEGISDWEFIRFEGISRFERILRFEGISD